MARCTNCGEENAPPARHCSACGVALGPTDSAPAAQRGVLGGTLVGMPSPFAPPDASLPPTVPMPRPGHQEPSASQAPTLAVPELSPSLAPTQAAPTVAAPGFGRTVIGLPSLDQTAARLAQQSQAAAPPPPAALAPERAEFRSTQQGFGAAVSAPAPPPVEAPLPGGTPSFQRTLLGVATPGIAPTGSMQAPPPPPAASPVPTADPPTAFPPPPRLPSRTAGRPKFPWGWAAALVAGAGLLGAGVALLTKKTPRLVVTAFEVTTTGTDRLVVRCESCEPGQSLSLGGRAEKLVQELARLEPPARLAVGNNALSVRILDESGAEVAVIPLVVPIAFRVETALLGRHADPPFAEVIVQAPEGSEVTIDGQPAPLDHGRATRTLTLSEAVGENARVLPLAREVPVKVVTAGVTKHTSARVQTAVVPLELLTPAEGHVAQAGPLSVSGRTLPGARVRLGEQSVTADRAGEFAFRLDHASPGPVRVRTETPDLVARTAVVTVRAAGGPPGAEPVRNAPFQPGQNAEWVGTVVESRSVDEKTTLLLELTQACAAPPCLARIFYGQAQKLAPGRQITARGQVLAVEPLTLRASELH